MVFHKKTTGDYEKRGRSPFLFLLLINKFFDTFKFNFCGPFWNIFEVIFGRKVIPKLVIKPFNLSLGERLRSLEVIGVSGITKVHFWFLSISGAPLSFFFTKRSTKKIKKWGNLIPHFELVSFVLKFDFCGPFRNQIIIFFFHKEIFEEKIKFLELRLGEGL